MKRLIAVAILSVAAVACGYKTANGVTPSRFYKCEDQRGLQRPAFFVDTKRDDTIIYPGNGIEFTDIKTGAHVRLREVDGYWCHPTQEQERRK